MNALLHVSALRNRYFAIRHGHSQANELRIIVSDPRDGEYGYGLTGLGCAQVLRSIDDACKKFPLDREALIYSSPFQRAVNTAILVQAVLQTRERIRRRDQLRERWFGKHDHGSNERYESVWARDREDPDHADQDVESASQVLDRTTRFIVSLEAEHLDKNILLVSHGDALQILQCGFARLPASDHRALPHLETAEIREFTLIS